jgi:protein-disulfide isomerase
VSAATRIGAVAGVAVAIVVLAIAVSSGGEDHARGGMRGVQATAKLLEGIPQRGLALGRDDAPVTLVEFADPQCPFCREYSTGTWPSIVQKYVRTGKVRMELRLLGFVGPDSLRAAKALWAAGQQHRLWNATALLYENQGQENTGYVTDAFLRKILGGVAGLDVERAMGAREAAAVKAEIGASHTAQNVYAVTATPTLLIGPTGGDLRKIAEQTPSPEQLGATLDDALAKARG